MSKKFFIIAAVMIVIVILGGLFYWFKQRDSEIVDNNTVILAQPIVKWQKTTITIEETTEKISIRINAPRIIISNNYRVDNEVNQTIARRIESLKDDFMSGVNTAAYKNGETNTLNIDTKVLLITPRLVSLAFTATEHLAGINDNEPEQTFIIFDLVKGKLMIEGNEMFRDDIAWSRAVKIMKNYLLVDYQGDPNCDLLFAPKHNGFATSCIGIDQSRRGKHLSITKDIPISMIQEFLLSSVLSDIIMNSE